MKIGRVCLFIVAVLMLMSCSTNHSSDNYVSIKGVFDIPDDIELTLSKVEHGDKFVVASCKVNSNKEYGFNISPDDEGFYLLGTKWMDIPIYVKGNQVFNINFSNENGFEQLNTPDEENRILDAWFHSNDTLNIFQFNRPRSKTYEEFFPFYKEFMPVMQEQHNLVNSSNKRFNQLMHALIDVNIEYTALHFIFTPRMKHPTAEQMPQFYHDFMKGDNIKNAIILDVPNGYKALRSHQQFKALHTGLGKEKS